MVANGHPETQIRQLASTGNGGLFPLARVIRLFEQEVRLGYWPRVEFNWIAAVSRACELRAEHSPKIVVRAMDLFHGAIAIEVGADALLSFDDDQIALAGMLGFLCKISPRRSVEHSFFLPPAVRRSAPTNRSCRLAPRQSRGKSKF
jgi:hypothetical protein